MNFIRTVLGDIPPDKLGVCYAHEHIIIAPSFTTLQNPDFQLDSVENAASELTEFYLEGGRSMIDSMPCDSGRDIEKLAEVSRRSRVHIIAPTGIHLEKYYPPGHWSESYTEEELAELFIADIELGIDANDYSGPFVRRTSYRAGVIKIASGLDKISQRDSKIFRAAAKAHLETGSPILTHTEQGTAGLEQVELLHEAGADLKHVCISHLDRKPDTEYLRDILQCGVKLEFDSAFRWKPGTPNHTERLVVELIEEFPNQIMLGMDAARRSYWKSYGGTPGLNYLLTVFKDRLLMLGITEEFLEKIFVQNPAETYCFVRKTNQQNREQSKNYEQEMENSRN